MKWYSFVLLFLGFSIESWSQHVVFEARVDHREISQDQYVEVEFVLENGEAKSFLPPSFQGWSVISGPSTSSQISIVNGVRSSSISYLYTLSPRAVGSFVIGPATVQVNGKVFSTDPVTIKVIKANPNQIGGTAKALSKEDLFVTVKATPAEAYIGQQIHLEYKLYTTLDVENYNVTFTPEFKGFHSSAIPRFNFPTTRETINGRTYVAKVIQAFSIYPIQSGDFNIDPMHTRVSVVVDEGRDANSFFLLPNTKGVNVISNPLNIPVKPLPHPIPDQFSGAVGRFRMMSEIDQLALKTNEAASISIYLEGDGDLNRVGKPYLQLDSNVFQEYEPKITKENTDYQTVGFIGMREFNFPIVALAPGVHKVIPSFSYFDIDSNRFVTLAAQVYNINVTGTATPLSKSEQEADTRLEPLPLIVNPKLGNPNPFIGSTWYYLVLLFPGLVLLGRFVYQKQKERNAFKGQSERIKSQARQHALNCLDSLDKKIEDTTTPVNIDNINAVLSECLRTQWELGDRPITLKEWQQIQDQQSLADGIKETMKNLYKEFELAIYAGQPSGIKFHELIQQAKSIIKQL